MKRIKNDINGNGRFVVHFLEFITAKDRAEAPNDLGKIRFLFNRAIYKCKPYGGRKYRGKEFGGCIVFQESSEELMADTIEKIKSRD